MTDTEWVAAFEAMRLPMPDGRPRRVWRAHYEEPIEADLQLFDRDGGNCWRHNGLWSSTHATYAPLPWPEFVILRGPLAECDPHREETDQCDCDAGRILGDLRALVTKLRERQDDRSERWRGWSGAMFVAASDAQAVLDEAERRVTR